MAGDRLSPDVLNHGLGRGRTWAEALQRIIVGPLGRRKHPKSAAVLLRSWDRLAPEGARSVEYCGQTASDLHVLWSRVGESNPGPIHYE